MTIREELERIKGQQPTLKAEDVVAWARDNPESSLHAALEWDDAAAAEEYRIWQARRLIAIHVVDDHGQRQFVSLSVDRPKGGGYRAITEVAAQPDLAAVMLRDALAELKRVQGKYSRVRALAAVWAEVDRADRIVSGERDTDAA